MKIKVELTEFQIKILVQALQDTGQTALVLYLKNKLEQLLGSDCAQCHQANGCHKLDCTYR